ncbi:hypothetical protein T484DRAFT_3369180 [Baffinella frigidus]|nr:hypothetical protein T484DRAFT_3369180 [Cryptophyta sp. CCMP2293]
MGQPSVALTFIQRARDIREASLGELHMDTGLLYNNMGACFEMLDRVTEAIESFQRARDVFAYEHGLSHPRTATVMRNLARVKNRRFDFKVPPPPSLLLQVPVECLENLYGNWTCCTTEFRSDFKVPSPAVFLARETACLRVGDLIPAST